MIILRKCVIFSSVKMHALFDILLNDVFKFVWRQLSYVFFVRIALAVRIFYILGELA